MFNDTRIICRHGSRDVLQQRFELQWADGSMMQSHAVAAHGVTDHALRALPMPGERFLLVDVGRLCPSLREDLPPAFERDRPGLVFFALRRQYRTRDAFIEAAAAIGELIDRAPGALVGREVAA
jgi:hypothetical protein